MKKTGQGLNQGNIQNLNRTLLITLLRREGVCARSHLAELSGLKQATVTNIMNDLIGWGLVREVGFLTGMKGRRSIGISINSDDFAVIGIRIARKNYSVGMFDLSGNDILVRRVSVEAGQTPRGIFDDIKKLTAKMIRDRRKRRVLAIGLAIPGPYSIKRGRIELMTGVSGWNEIAIEDELTKQFHIPVYVEQDANAAAIAQSWYNRDEFSEDGTLVYIAVGQGVGAGIMSGGKLLKGSIGIAGEIGHTTIDIRGPRCTCGNVGCLENYCSSIAFTDRLNERRKKQKKLSFTDAALLVREGDETALAVMKECCDALSTGIVNVINSFNPEVLIIGDEMSHIVPEEMLGWINENVRERLVPEIYENTRITMSVVEHDSMVHGAAIIAILEVFSHLELFFKAGDEKSKESK